MRRPRVFGPKAADHPSVGEKCPFCQVPFEAGDMTVLVPLGPDDEENRRKMAEGAAYIEEAVEAHERCPVPIGTDF